MSNILRKRGKGGIISILKKRDKNYNNNCNYDYNKSLQPIIFNKSKNFFKFFYYCFIKRFKIFFVITIF